MRSIAKLDQYRQLGGRKLAPIKKPANKDPKCPQKSTPGIIEMMKIYTKVVITLREFKGIWSTLKILYAISNPITLHIDVEAPTALPPECFKIPISTNKQFPSLH